jgi:hypothetical protein
VRSDYFTKIVNKVHFEKINTTMAGAYMEPETGDLNAAESKISALRSMATPVEHSLIFNRRERNEQVNLCIHHYDDIQQLHLVVFEGNLTLPEIKQEIELSFEEAKLLRDFLKRPEIVAILTQ